VTELGLFDFDASGHLRLRALYPDTSLDEVAQNTGFRLVVADDLSTIVLPDPEVVAMIRALDPLGVHIKELQPRDRTRRFAVASCSKLGSSDECRTLRCR